jgi:hypothetical protein
MRRILLFLFFIIIFFHINLVQKKDNISIGAEFKSPRTTRIINILLKRNDVYDFCDNFYDFFYITIPKTTNEYYIVEKNMISDSLQEYNAIKINSIELKRKLLSDEKREKVYIIPLY